MTVLTGGRSLLQFSVASFAGLVRPLFTELLYLAGSFFVALFAILQHLLMFFMGEANLPIRGRQLYNVGGKDSSCEKMMDNRTITVFFMFLISLVVFIGL